ncbi:hypothetical protein B0H17DRAFT_1181277 [Mycena rosella]|uniref:Uncharacterized protein n=1 Tax=Mycena rosella TaxID=1033263 RepID=A0AAD7GB93_MYCRO|nr:hypothetical protein B0H17DRAFT_1181277 [Mycena rosella]
MPKKTNGKQRAAINHEAAKHNEAPVAPRLPVDPSLTVDPTFVDSDPESEAGQPEISVPVEQISTASTSLKRKNPDADLHPAREAPKRMSRTTAWREATGQTKKARTKNGQKNGQPSIGSLFKRAKLKDIFKTMPNPRKVALAVRHESEEPDSDIEMIDAPLADTVEHLSGHPAAG